MDDAPALPTLELPALHANHSGCWLRLRGGVTNAVGKGEAIVTAADTPLLILNAPLVATVGLSRPVGAGSSGTLRFRSSRAFRCAHAQGAGPCAGTAEPGGDDDVPLLLQQAAAALLAHCSARDWVEREGAWTALQGLAKLRWSWAPVLATAIDKPARAERWLFSRLPEWEETAERPQPAQVDLLQADVLGQLDHITGHGSESRQGQQEYAARAAHIFAPRIAWRPAHAAGRGGHGYGQDAGLSCPASLWAHASGGTVWVDLYQGLQRQLRREARRVWGDPTGLWCVRGARTICAS
jgi:ATP-dependent DNA helicase DinG